MAESKSLYPMIRSAVSQWYHDGITAHIGESEFSLDFLGSCISAPSRLLPIYLAVTWDKPRFDSPFEQRRLRILNGLFFAVVKMNGKASVRGREARDIGILSFNSIFPSIWTDQIDRVAVHNSCTPERNLETGNCSFRS